jgi:hypothetical protein
MTLFQCSDAIVLNYDDIVYQYQSSGVLWLAAFFDLTVFSLSHTWMSREALRLDVDYFEYHTVEQCSESFNALLGETKEKKRKNKVLRRDVQPNEYFNGLFTDISDWLLIQSLGE